MSQERIRILIVLMVAVLGLLFFRTFQIQILEGNTYEDRAENQSRRRQIWKPERGKIIDRNGLLLASSIQTASDHATSKRFFPQGHLASQLLGFVGREGQGLQGLEYFFEEKLRGIDGWSYQTVNAQRKAMPGLERKGRAPTPGLEMVLTIDQMVQEITENAIRKGFQKLEADRVSAVVLNPNNGEILAMASYPDFDPNYVQSARGKAIRNDLVSLVYEPGSTFKIVTACAALEEQTINPLKMIDGEGGRLRLRHGEVIRDTKDHGQMNMTDAMAYSSNVAFAKIASTLGNERFYRFARAFGFGSPTMVEIPGEESGSLKPPHEWSGRTLVTMAMGHEVMATPLQMAMAFATVANGGELLEPRVIREWRNPNTGEIVEQSSRRVVRRVISKETAAMVRSMLHEVVRRGTARNIKSDFLDFAGKTGTAEKFDRSENRYNRNSMVSSFIGMVPSNNPQYVTAVVVDEPRTARVGARTAAPIFQEIMERIYLNPKVSPVQFQLTQVESLDPCAELNLVGMGVSAAKELARKYGCHLDLKGSGAQIISQKVDNHSKQPSLTVLAGNPLRKAMPDLRGLPARDALELLGSLQGQVEIAGQGFVREQFPLPEMPVYRGQNLKLILGEGS